MTKIEEYANEIPQEIRRAIRGLDSNYRTAIFVVLYKHGELSFSDLQKKLEIDKAMLNYHLGKLVESALVHHYYKHKLGIEKYSFYNVTPFGQNFVEILSQFLRPQPYFITPRESSTTSRIFTSLCDIVTQQPDVLKTEGLRDVLMNCICAELSRKHESNVWLIANDTSMGSTSLGIIRRERKETIMEGSIPPSTI